MQVRNLRLQRNLSIAITVIMFVTNVLLIIKLYKQDIVTRLVPTIEQEQIIGSHYVNEAALKVRAEQFLHLLFSMKKENSDLIMSSLLKQVDNAAYEEFKKQIEHLAEDISIRNYRYVFTDLQGFEFDYQKLTVKVKGYLETYLGGKQLSSKYKEYLIGFFNRSGILTLKSFEEIEDVQ